MTTQRLQRMVVRMLFDPILVDRIYGDQEVKGLEEASRTLLKQADRRAWGIDPYRRSRALTALIDEFPASSAQAGVSTLDAFFSSAVFHDCISDRTSMAAAFAQWLAQRAGPVARIEGAMAQVRRPRPKTGSGLVLSPTVAIFTVPSGTLEQYQTLRARLGDNPVAALAEGTIEPVTRVSRRGKEHLLVETAANGEVTVSSASGGLTKLLEAATNPCTRARLLAIARDLGATSTQAGQVVDGLKTDGLLVDATPPEDDE